MWRVLRLAVIACAPRRSIRSQVGRGVATRTRVVLGVAAKTTDLSRVALHLEAKRRRGGLALVVARDNGSEDVNRDVADLFERERVIQLKNLPQTPQHNPVGGARVRRAPGGVGHPRARQSRAERGACAPRGGAVEVRRSEATRVPRLPNGVLDGREKAARLVRRETGKE